MASTPVAYVLDAWAVMAYLEDQLAAEAVEALIIDAHERQIPLLITVINAAEVWYAIARNASETRANQRLSDIAELGVHFVPADWSLALEAARFKSKHKMSLADCFAAALAKQNQAELLTGDPEFKQVSEDVRIHWL